MVKVRDVEKVFLRMMTFVVDLIRVEAKTADYDSTCYLCGTGIMKGESIAVLSGEGSGSLDVKVDLCSTCGEEMCYIMSIGYKSVASVLRHGRIDYEIDEVAEIIADMSDAKAA